MVTLTHKQVDKADEMVGAYEEAISYLESAIESLKSTKDSEAEGFAEELSDVIRYIKDDKEQYDAILAEDYRQEIEELTRDYWRSVI